MARADAWERSPDGQTQDRERKQKVQCRFRGRLTCRRVTRKQAPVEGHSRILIVIGGDSTSENSGAAEVEDFMGTEIAVTADAARASVQPASVVRVVDQAGDAVGSGFMVAPNVVATCAHVAATAMGADPESQDMPVGHLSVEF